MMFNKWTWKCVNMKCGYAGNGKEGEHCPECGRLLHKVNSKESERISTNKAKFKADSNWLLKEGEKTDAKRLKENARKLQKEQQRAFNLLFHDSISDTEIQKRIYQDMENLRMHESGTAWMRAGTLLSFNSTEQMIGAGFKALIDQNKLIIRQNELLLRELKRINENLPVNGVNSDDLDKK